MDSVSRSSLDMSGFMETQGVSESLLRFAKLDVTLQDRDKNWSAISFRVFAQTYAITNRVAIYSGVKLLQYNCYVYVLHVLGYSSVSGGALGAFIIP